MTTDEPVDDTPPEGLRLVRPDEDVSAAKMPASPERTAAEVPVTDEPVDVPLNVVALQGVTARERSRPLIAVLLIAVVGLALILVDFRLGTLVLAGSAATALIMRAVLPTRRAGLLVVRTRRIDLTILSVLTASLFILALITPAQQS